MYDLKKHYLVDKNLILKCIDRTLLSGELELGPEMKNFEKNFSKFCNSKYSISVSSGSMGLLIALKCLNLKKNDEVITVANSDIPTSHAITLAGAKIKWVDIEATSLNINPKEIEKNINSRTKVILPVHLFGIPANMKEIKKIASKYKLKIIEDACLATGAKFGKEKIGSIGDLTVFSFNPGKILDGIGPGGMITTNNKNFYLKILKLRNYGRGKGSFVNPIYSEIIGFNAKLSSVNAAVLNIRLKKLNSYIKKRRSNAKLYKELLTSKKITFQKPYNNSFPVWRNFTIRVKNRNCIYNSLRKKGFKVYKGYIPPNHLDICYKNKTQKLIKLPITEKISKEIINLPCHPYITKKEITNISSHINNLLGI